MIKTIQEGIENYKKKLLEYRRFLKLLEEKNGEPVLFNDCSIGDVEERVLFYRGIAILEGAVEILGLTEEEEEAIEKEVDEML